MRGKKTNALLNVGTIIRVIEQNQIILTLVRNFEVLIWIKIVREVLRLRCTGRPGFFPLSKRLNVQLQRLVQGPGAAHLPLKGSLAVKAVATGRRKLATVEITSAKFGKGSSRLFRINPRH